MNKGLAFFGLCLLTLSGCGISEDVLPPNENKEEETPTIIVPTDDGYVQGDDVMMFPVCSAGSGCIGDPMPFYDDGKMNIFYLEDARNYRMGFHPVALLQTTDFVTYEDHGIVIPYVDDRRAVDFAIGTGSVIKDKNGLYHFFYTGHNSNSHSGLPFFEKIQHATSADLIHWTKIPEDGFYGDSNDFRDPHVVYIADSDEYWMLVTTNKDGVGVLRRYSSSNLKTWIDHGVFYTNTEGTYNMECSTLFKYKGYWYLSFSEQGAHRVTHYRYKKNLSDNWIVPSLDYFDDECFYAGKITGDENRLFLYGWCGTKSNASDTGNLDWAGNLVGHELYQKENGELAIKPITEIQNAINHELDLRTYGLSEKLTEKTIDGVNEQFITYNPFPSPTATRMSFDFTAQEEKGYVGLTLGVRSMNTVGTLALSIDVRNNNVSFYNNIQNMDDFGRYNYRTKINIEKLMKNHVEIFYENKVISIYINNEIALTARCYQAAGSCFALFSDEVQTTFENIHFYC